MDPAILDTQAVFDKLPDEPALNALADLATAAKYDRQ